MKLLKVKKIENDTKHCYDITVENNHNFFCNDALIHNCDYRGEIKVLLVNHNSLRYTVKKGDRIAQLVFVPVVQVQMNHVDRLTETDRGSGGFGSTGR